MSKWNVGKCAVCGNDLAVSLTFGVESATAEPWHRGIVVECPECKLRYKSVTSSTSAALIAEDIRILADRMNVENLAICEALNKQQAETREEEPAAEVVETPLEIEAEPEKTIKTLRRTSLGVVYHIMKDTCPRYGVGFCVSMGRVAQKGETMKLMDSLLDRYLKGENIPASELHHGNVGNRGRCQYVIKPPCVLLTLPTTIARAKQGVCFGIVYSKTDLGGQTDFAHIRNLGIESELFPRYLKETDVRIPTLCKQLKRAREDFEHKRDLLLGLGLINRQGSDVPAINTDMWSDKQFVIDLRAALKSNLPGKVEKQVRGLVEKYGLFVTF